MAFSAYASKDADRIEGLWSPEEDEASRRLVQTHGHGNWYQISKSIPGRSANSCHLRWYDPLSPQVQHRPFIPEEDDTIFRAHARFGNSWDTIVRLLNGRTGKAVRIRWISTLQMTCLSFSFFAGGKATSAYVLPAPSSSAVSPLFFCWSGVDMAGLAMSSLFNSKESILDDSLGRRPLLPLAPAHQPKKKIEGQKR